MRSTRVLLRQLINLTLFTRSNCSLCETAKLSLTGIRKQGDVGYEEIDVMSKVNKKWKDLYEFDVPVVRI